MSKVIKNSIPSNLIDFSSTSLDSNHTGSIELTDKVEYYYTTGEVAAVVPVKRIIDFLESNNIHVPEDKYPHECDALEYFDVHFDEATQAYFNSELATEMEVDHAA